jgi:hypothetical protein
MKANASPFRKVASLVLASSFLFATAPDMFGLHGCPYHGIAADVATASEVHLEATHQRQHDGVAMAAHADHGSSESGSGGPCTWLVDCHACCVQASVPINYPTAPIAIAVAGVDGHSAVATRRPLGPRHKLFELHLPNAPPLLT